MPEENRKSGKRYGIIAACGVLALALIAGACWMGRSAGAGKDVGEETAKLTALGHAQVSESGLSRYEIARDDNGGVPVYEVKFAANGIAYDYEISAADGGIVKFSREAEEAAPPPVQDAPAPEGGDIGEAKAKEIALAHAGVTADSVTGYRWEQDYDGGALVYELEFFAGGYEYDYEIKAADGSILKVEKDGGVPAAQTGSPAAAPACIGEAKAKEIAFGHAGVTADAVARCAVELDHHDGRGGHHGAGCCEYEVDFRSGGYEYEYKIDAVTGEILEFEQDLEG